ncbi:flagellar protein FlhE [Scandinavium goeteborgense]|uniref:Flagellar protein FlhE n=1 Tax=Scandinavium goeteborgense TaxID=1851514 RepID=A0A4R6EN76_SCAGO|nr:flagellar protein FlhE [Scandinavium goeteborgense]TDN59413.1 flagellar protein FlhE [Scandinavium goeteborgense]
MRYFLLALLFVTPLAQAANGSWTSQSFGGTLARGQQTLKSRPIQAPSALPKGVVATRLAWSINPNGPTPVGFRIHICGGNRCLPLPGLSGEMALPAGYPAAGPYRFEYRSVVRGQLYPPLTVLTNQITLEYRTPKSLK